jgi:predicted small lipoprotein YifL
LALAAAACVVAACGSRGPLDFEYVAVGADAAADVAVVDATDDAPRDAPADVRREAGPGPLQCGACVTQQCGQSILQCFQNPQCQQIFQCVATRCLASGAPDTRCIFDCAAGDLRAAAQIASIFQCITALCGPACGSILGGGLPGGGGGGGGRDGGRARGDEPGRQGSDRTPPADLPGPSGKEKIPSESPPWPEPSGPSD